MKKLLFALLLAGCTTAGATNNSVDAGVSVHAENQFKWYYDKYYPSCVRHCLSATDSWQCPNKCNKDFQQIKKVLIRAIRDNKEDDFADMMDSWYGKD